MHIITYNNNNNIKSRKITVKPVAEVTVCVQRRFMNFSKISLEILRIHFNLTATR